jgi:tripartite-type tricarboxylate transporter receptor subunit TctC
VKLFPLCIGLLASSLASLASAQSSYPVRPVTLVVGFAPGGGSDIAARIVQRRLGENLKQQVVVDNKAGAGGAIAADFTAKAPPDGYTIFLANVGALTVTPHIVAKLGYDPLRDFAPLTMGVMFANVLVVHPSVPAQNIAEFIKLANAKPGTMSYGTSGIASAGHLAGELFRLMAKAEIVHVPYKSGGQAMTDLLGGQILSSFASAPTAVPHVKSGKIRALGTTGATRSSFLPDVPTIAEAGFPGYETINWYAFVAPAKTPRDILERLHRDITGALKAPDVREQLLAAGMEPAPGTPENLAATIEREYKTWARVVKEAKIQAN